MKQFKLMFILVIGLFLFGQTSASLNPTQVHKYIQGSCYENATETIDIPEEYNVRLNDSRVSQLDCEQINKYEYRRFIQESDTGPDIDFDFLKFFQILGLGTIISFAAGFIANKRMEDSRDLLFPSIISFSLTGVSLIAVAAYDFGSLQSLVAILVVGLPTIPALIHVVKYRRLGIKRSFLVILLYLVPITMSSIAYLLSITIYLESHIG